MLTPCAVATFHQLAGLLTVWQRPLSPIYNLIDLLIVEEAGQVSPEIAGPSFSLAKRAIVVGDALQIEPAWSVTPAIDNANAKTEGLDPKVLHETGQAAVIISMKQKPLRNGLQNTRPCFKTSIRHNCTQLWV